MIRYTTRYEDGISIEDLHGKAIPASLYEIAFLAMKDGYGYEEKIPLNVILEYADEKWLLRKGFIEQSIKIGDHFKRDDIFVVARVSRNPEVCLINILTGGRAAEIVRVQNPGSISKDEFSLITGGRPDLYKPLGENYVSKLLSRSIKTCRS
jgi:hypothetical protein